MPSPYQRTVTSSLPGRVLARLILITVGFLLGIALFMPWNKLWASALASVDERLPSVGLRWEAIDRDGPLGFRVRELRITVADTPGSLTFHQAYVTVGFSPVAHVRLDTRGSQCELDLYQNGVFEFEGDMNLTALLGGADFNGVIHTSGNLFMPAGAILPKKGWIDLRSQQLTLPDSTTVQDVAFTAEIEESKMDVRDFTMMRPITIKTAGTGEINPRNLFDTTFHLSGEMMLGKRAIPYETSGTLAQALW